MYACMYVGVLTGNVLLLLENKLLSSCTLPFFVFSTFVFSRFCLGFDSTLWICMNFYPTTTHSLLPLCLSLYPFVSSQDLLLPPSLPPSLPPFFTLTNLNPPLKQHQQHQHRRQRQRRAQHLALPPHGCTTTHYSPSLLPSLPPSLRPIES